MLIELVQIKQDRRGNYSLDKVYVNPRQIIYMSENTTMRETLKEGKMKLGLNQNLTSFTNIKLNYNDYSSDIVVIGHPELIESKIIAKQQKQLLKG